MDAEPRFETVSIETAVEGKCRITIEKRFVFLEGDKKMPRTGLYFAYFDFLYLLKIFYHKNNNGYSAKNQ